MKECKRDGFTFYIIEAWPKGYAEDDVRYYCSGRGSCWKKSPHEATTYSMRSWAEKRIELEKPNCNKIRILTYSSKLEHEEEK